MSAEIPGQVPEIEKDLKWLADLCLPDGGVITHCECCTRVGRIQDEIKALRRWLVEANLMLRSCCSVAERKGVSTNWEALQHQLLELLKLQRMKINEFHGYNPPDEPSI